MLPDQDVAEICWAARNKIIEKLALGTMPPWEIIPAWRQDLMTEIVRAARTGSTAEQVHALWWKVMADHGHRYGCQLDVVSGTSPMMRPWAELEDWGRSIWRSVHMLTLALTVDPWLAVHSDVPRLCMAAGPFHMRA